MTDKHKRIMVLAKAMGMQECLVTPSGYVVYKAEFGGDVFDPENDANDDYAVLEWMREQGEDFFRPALMNQWNYKWFVFVVISKAVQDWKDRHDHV